MKVAIVHYWLFHMRGGEKVIEALCEMYPDADIFTHVYDPRLISDTIRQHDVRTTFIQNLPFSRQLYKKYLPLMPMALEELDLSEYDLVISSESGPSKGVIVRSDALHVCYCHTPMRYLWDLYHLYQRGSGMLTRVSTPYLLHRMRRWDVTSAARVDHFIANSHAVAMRINKYWRREAEVIPPPVDVEKFSIGAPREDFYLCVSEMVPYKRIDLAIKACNALERRLVIIGDGPDLRALRRIAGPTIEFLGHVPHSVLTEHLSSSRALLFPGQEDFGIVLVEAMASGRPVIGFARGGARDTIIEHQTGLFFSEQTVGSLIEAIIRFEQREHLFDPNQIRTHALKFSKELFKERFAACIDALIEPKPQPERIERPDRGGALQVI